MRTRRHYDRLRRQIRNAIVQVNKVMLRLRTVRPRLPRGCSRGASLNDQRSGPLHRRARHAVEALVHEERRPRHRLPLRRERGAHGRSERHARVRRPASCSARAARVRRTLLCIDGDASAGPLQHRRRGQPHRTRAQHRDVGCAIRRLHRLLRRHHRGTPRERPPAAAMAVVVHDRLVAHFLDIEPRPGRPKRAQAHRDAEDAVGMRADRNQRRVLVVQGEGRSRRHRRIRRTPLRASAQAESAQTGKRA